MSSTRKSVTNAVCLTMDGGEEAGAEVVVEVLVLAHLEHFLPLLHGHLVLDALSCLFLITDLLPTKLNKIQHI